ncbi:hypothetical protein PF005_g5672 [Phytophthora fragariae]|nr:hypothetical protein PF009_g5543 [Phytophthora fragariae]KAE9127134.1 hypothetical protein PF007_g5732 [Phytophthora fragariae]KAE9225109.1 hypothetical protein PF005_g5672 [Phytophthora fragariae]KAE9246666.1 hypothetical protein PF004_g4702 [Phytophthora fragariae]KAE9247314.1 hypothetical protein PF002_g6353 [Phytophthora fragariae]
MEDLLLYLAVRKFGASTDSAGGQAVLGVEQQTLARWEQHDAQKPSDLEDCVDTLHGLLLKCAWDAGTISTLSRVVKRQQDPRARQRFLTFAFQILQASAQRKPTTSEQISEQDDKFYDDVVRLLLLGVTDLWSAIRKDCAKTSAAIVLGFSSRSHIEQFIDSLLCVAIGSRSVSADKSQVTAWTEREGALLALSALLRSIKMDFTGDKLEDVGEIKVSQVKDDIKGILGARQVPAVKYLLGFNHALVQLPRCLVQTLKPAIYECLRHDQLSIRQLAAQCLVEYASLCEEPTRLLIFQEVISKLNRINRNDKVEIDSAMNPNDSELLDAFEAEGLLDVLARMAPCLPSSFLLKHWKFVFPTLEKYVMHIASSVRQKSSMVVLALAKQYSRNDSNPNTLSVSDEVSLKLIIQMLFSLSKQRSDGSEICWQQREGRLLSIEVLLDVLGESLLVCPCEACKLLRWKPEPTQVCHGRSGSLTALKSFFWAHDRAHSATWVLDADKAEEQHASLTENNHDNTERSSLVHAIGVWIVKNGGKNGLPSLSDEFWQQVLGGCIAQTKEAFNSSQFELRRISRQVLPGLMRLVIWTEQLEFLASTELEDSSVETSWPWTCVKYLLLHLRYQEESATALGETITSSVSQKLAANWKVVWGGIVALERNMQNCSIDVDVIVAQVEVKLIAFLSFGAAADSPRHVTRLLDSALRSIHLNLPESMQLRTLMGERSSANSLDRQFSIFMVPIFPAVIVTLQYLADREEGVGYIDQQHDDELSWSSRWLCLERTALAWLICDDMFRWITLSKSEAQSLLVESLGGLLRFSKTDLSPSETSEEVDRILQCLEPLQAIGTRMKDAAYMDLVKIHLRMWLRLIKSGSHDTAKVAIATTQLYSRRQQCLAIPDTKVKPAEGSATYPAAAEWDDWDNEEGEIQQATPVTEIQEPTLDLLFQEVLESLDATQLNLLCEAARVIPNLDRMQDIPVQRMQQQIESCLHTK